MKKRIIQMTLGLTALVASFLPQKAQAYCKADCFWGDCVTLEGTECGCTWYGQPYCIDP